MDRSNGYEGISLEFLARRGKGRSTGVGVKEVQDWARSLPPGAAVIDIGCGPGFPITEVLVLEGLNVFGLDAAPTFVQAFRQNFPNTPVACEPVQESGFFERTFDAALHGAEEYRHRLAAVGFSISSDYEEVGGSHYFDCTLSRK
jgi:2-polyprenyl-3-methyl-5-hydroxy-6-metoxy-1,4-benzoquinol methylase